jgi:hypothetical protein
MKYILLVSLMISCAIYSAVKMDFHVVDVIETKVLKLDVPQIIFEEERSVMTYILTATLLEENPDYAIINFNLIIRSTSGRSFSYDYPRTRIPMNTLMHLREVNYLYPLVFKATTV